MIFDFIKNHFINDISYVIEKRECERNKKAVSKF